MLEVKVEKWISSHLEWSQVSLQSLRGSLEMRRFKHVVMPTRHRHCLTLDPTPPTSPTARRR